MSLVNIAIKEQKSKQMMEMWKTYIFLCPRTVCTRGGAVAAGGEGGLDLREVPLWPERPSKEARKAMRRAATRQHDRHLIDRRGHRVLHLWMALAELLYVFFFGLFGLAEVLGLFHRPRRSEERRVGKECRL